MKKFLIYLTALCFHSSLSAGEPPGNIYEQSILDTIKSIQSQDHEQALTSTRELLKEYPRSRLGQILYADLLLAKAEPLRHIGSGLEIDQAIKDYRHELKQRWRHEKEGNLQGLLPENILFLADNQPYVIIIDQQSSRIYVYRNQQGTPVLEADYFITIGLKGYGKEISGDQKTPIGIYHVTRYIDGEVLPDLYGKGAFPISYPNAWDRRLERTGGGIWIHGTPSYTYNRSPWASNGCVVVSNPDFLHIGKFVSADLRTPVIVAKQVNWISEEKWQANRKEALQLLSTWVYDWESMDHETYRENYSQTDFESYGRDFKSWDGHKRWQNRNKTEVKVEFDRLSIFRYPDEENLMLMQFDQRYRSNDLELDSAKELFWRKQGDQWKIVYEEVRSFPEVGDQMVDN